MSNTQTQVPVTKLNGLILVNKEAGMTSHDVVFSLRKIIKDKQVGHIGTLDPMAEGLLVCLVGEAVKLSDYLMGSPKKYRLTLKLGEETDTWDATGTILKTVDKILDEEKIRKHILALAGNQSLPIPLYSAKKVDGKKLYEIARNASKKINIESESKTAESKTLTNVANDTFEGPLKDMNFWDITISEVQFPYASLEFWCSKGSFVRSWVYSLGRQLGTGAVMTKLQRLAIGKFELEASVTIKQLRERTEVSQIRNLFFYKNIWQALQNRTIVELDATEREKLKSGLVSYTLLNRIRELNLKDEVFCFFSKQLIGILFVSDVVEVRRVFVNSEQ